MLEMMQRIRSGNVGLKKVAPPPSQTDSGGGVMAEMAKLLVSVNYRRGLNGGVINGRG